VIGPLAYIGGKRRLAPRLIALFPPHTTYVEPFCGGAQVFFHKPPSRVEVLNDLDGEVVNFLRVCREHPEELARVLQYLVPSRALFGQFAEQNPAILTDVQRAARFLYLQKNAFGGQIVRRTYHTCVVKPSNFNPTRLPNQIRRAAERLQRVQIEHWPYERVLERYDRPSTFFYVDPPYIDIQLYRHNLSQDQFVALAKRLTALRGRFLLSINDHPLARDTFGDFDVRQIVVPYTATRRVPRVSELLVSNFSWPTRLEPIRSSAMSRSDSLATNAFP